MTFIVTIHHPGKNPTSNKGGLVIVMRPDGGTETFEILREELFAIQESSFVLSLMHAAFPDLKLHGDSRVFKSWVIEDGEPWVAVYRVDAE